MGLLGGFCVIVIGCRFLFCVVLLFCVCVVCCVI